MCLAKVSEQSHHFQQSKHYALILTADAVDNKLITVVITITSNEKHERKHLCKMLKKIKRVQLQSQGNNITMSPTYSVNFIQNYRHWTHRYTAGTAVNAS